ncbi:Metallo-hydrolase/oxidoreductase, partial [Aureobasidium melanogenum]
MTPTVTIDSAHDPNTGTWQYIVTDPYSMSGIIIDPVLDFDETTCTVSTSTADRLLSLVRAKGYHISRILETHTHTDHFSASSYIQATLERDQGHRPLTCIGKRSRQVRQMMYEECGFLPDVLACEFDEFLDDDGSFDIGCLQATVLHLPGHTLDHVGYMIEDNVFCGDVLLNADLRMSSCDYPSGNVNELYSSTRRLLGLPNHYRLWIGHDHTTPTRQCPMPYLSVGEQKQRHCHLFNGTPKPVFQIPKDQHAAASQSRTVARC